MLFQKLKSDRLLLASFGAALTELICHIWTFINEGYPAAELVRISFCALYIIAMPFIMNRKYVYIFFAAYGLAILYFNKYNNYTAFILVLITIKKVPRSRGLLLVLYFFDCLIALFIGHRTSWHALIHLVNCLWMWLVFQYDIMEEKRLVLTPDEEKILTEWLTLGELKSVECFGKNTVFRKLKEARERNGIVSNDDLLDRYLKETKSGLKR